jgi:hypothetical protein
MEPGAWFVQLATGMQYVVNVTRVLDDLIYFDGCAWVAWTGRRLGEFIRNGPDDSTEIEVITPGVIGRGALIGAWRWPHEVPTRDR